MQTSIQIKIFILLGAATAVSAYIVSWRVDSKLARLVAWIQSTYPGQWNALPWLLRHIHTRAAVELLSKSALHNDQQFMQRYDEIKHQRRWMLNLLIAGCTAIGFVILGTQFWGWHW